MENCSPSLQFVSSDDEACITAKSNSNTSNSDGSSNGDVAANDSSCDSGRVSTPASFEGCCEGQICHQEKKNNFRPWEDNKTDWIKEEPCGGNFITYFL